MGGMEGVKASVEGEGGVKASMEAALAMGVMEVRGASTHFHVPSMGYTYNPNPNHNPNRDRPTHRGRLVSSRSQGIG